MLPGFPKAVMAVALACSLGFHWAFFQSLAWVGMVVNYSQDASLKEALEKTFDGKHPCALCKEIDKNKRSEKKAELLLPVSKFEFLALRSQFIFTAPSSFWHLAAVQDYLKSLPRTPPTPPPRAVLG